MSDGDWSDYVAGAGSDPAALTAAADDMGDATAAVQPELEAIDTSALPDDAADDVASAQYDAGEAASWDQWTQGDLADVASWQDEAAGDVQEAKQWAAFGDMDAAQEALGAAGTASDIGDECGRQRPRRTLGSGPATWMAPRAILAADASADSTAYDGGSVRRPARPADAVAPTASEVSATCGLDFERQLSASGFEVGGRSARPCASSASRSRSTS